MQLNNIKAVILRHSLVMLRDPLRLTDMLYYPVLDIIMFGFTGMWLDKTGTTSLAILTCLVCWQIFIRTYFEIAFSLLEELWSKNLVNIFSTTLTISEWMVSAMTLGIIKSFFSFTFSSFAVWLFFGFNILKFGLLIIPCLLSLAISGWCVGFLTSSLLFYKGQRAQSLVWMFSWLFVPFCAVFYPLNILPKIIQMVGKALPMTYIFEAIRSKITTGLFPISNLFISYSLNIFYLTLAMLIFKIMFERSKKSGFSRLEND